MDLTERTLSRQDVFTGHILRVHLDTVLLPDGRQAQREIIDHNGAVAVVALDSDGQVLLVEQYRYAIGRNFLEIPAGKLDSPDEDPYAAAMRELREETGATCPELVSLGKIYAAPGCYGEVLHLYLAENLQFGETDPDDDEFLLLHRLPFAEAVKMALDGRLEDGKTVAALLKAKCLLEERER